MAGGVASGTVAILATIGNEWHRENLPNIACRRVTSGPRCRRRHGINQNANGEHRQSWRAFFLARELSDGRNVVIELRGISVGRMLGFYGAQRYSLRIVGLGRHRGYCGEEVLLAMAIAATEGGDIGLINLEAWYF